MDDGYIGQPGDYILPNIILVSHSGNAIEIKNMVIELNIYESIYKKLNGWINISKEFLKECINNKEIF